MLHCVSVGSSSFAGDSGEYSVDGDKPVVEERWLKEELRQSQYPPSSMRRMVTPSLTVEVSRRAQPSPINKMKKRRNALQ